MIHFSKFRSEKEQLAWRHYSSTVKLAGKDNSNAKKVYKKQGWLTEDPSVLSLLKDGYDSFELKTAKRILVENKDKIFFNNCPKCGQLARTPTSKQCKHCGHDWHDKK